jgi:hypothetical protein
MAVPARIGADILFTAVEAVFIAGKCNVKNEKGSIKCRCRPSQRDRSDCVRTLFTPLPRNESRPAVEFEGVAAGGRLAAG